MGRFGGVELTDLELSGPRLQLRPWRREDVPGIVAAMSDPRMHEFVALPQPYTAANAGDFIQLAARPRRDGTGLDCAAVERSTGRLVGSGTLTLAGDAEIGYWVAPDAQGNGYAAEMASVLAGWGFSVGLRRVRLACDVANIASARAALAAGFTFEGISRGAVTSAGGGAVPARHGDLARFARLPADPPGRVPYAFPPLDDAGRSDGVLRIRPTHGDDAPALAETDDAQTLAWSFTGRATPWDDVRRAAEQARLQWLVGAVAGFSMVDERTARVAGAVRLRKTGPPQVGGIGYVVHPAFRGRGYTARALRLLASWAFEVAGFARLEAGAKVGNDASLRAAANAGFEPDGVLRRRLRNPDGTFSDEVRYALMNPRYA